MIQRILLVLLLLLSLSSPAWATNWCGDVNNQACFLMEDDGNESNESSNSSDGLTETSGDIPQDADEKFGTYSRDFEEGDTEYLEQADGLSTDISGADQALTICLWVKLESFPGAIPLVEKWDAGSSTKQYFLERGDSGNLRGGLSPNGTSQYFVGGASGISAGTWYHVCMVYNDTNMQLYRNGSTDGSAYGYTAGIADTNSTFVIGGNIESGSPTDYYDGLIDEVGIFDTALDSTDINDIMNNGLFEIEVASHRVPTVMELRGVTVY